MGTTQAALQTAAGDLATLANEKKELISAVRHVEAQLSASRQATAAAVKALDDARAAKATAIADLVRYGIFIQGVRVDTARC